MKRLFISLLVLFFAFFGAQCSQDETEKKKIVAKINDYEMTLSEFQAELAGELELSGDYKLTNKDEKAFLDQLIQKELLIQEAKQMNLDTREEFIRDIQRYWESTLIKNLMELKGKEITKKVYVSEEEIKNRYARMKAERETLPPLDEMREKLIRRIKEEKKTRRLKEWVSQLRGRADIEINEKLLDER